MSEFLLLTPRDPVIARDGRPFGAGQRMKGLNWPYPSVSAGALRTLIGKLQGGAFDREEVTRLRHLEIAGPLPISGKELFFPAPKDLVVQETTQRGFAARPVSAAVGCNWPATGLQPVMLPEELEEDFKPGDPPDLWSTGQIAKWLVDEAPATVVRDEKGDWPAGFLDAPEKEERMHVQIDPGSGTSEEGMLFMTTGLDFPKEMGMSMRLDGTAPLNVDALFPMGGERRLVHFQSKDAKAAWQCPDGVKKQLAGASKVRMVLATPGLFAGGWKPGWLGANLTGSPPGLSAVTLKLIGVCIDRWKPISGWNYDRHNGQPLGPKAVRRLVPAGGVYFFEKEKGEAANLADAWLKSVCDNEQDRRDGFGLALWGIWNERKVHHG